ncbi:NAD(P)H-dependent oxidoreductase [Pseudoruegeria sp. SK021]|uniref:NAD(P)H-dependent oxidoreductase n=1 Tax=Pseudoruegeria sp. SK021 TaxID=1933035 RepID=UPI000A23742B|nr:NAD(P)H-dependent oxidoreductase [Pseudoruegeria sp. SK021]OSP55709.1 potassium transporter KefG [Pseudoruegeria sp. SK021]
MARTLLYFAHPGQRQSHANWAMAQAARPIDGVTFVDLYADYPRYNIDIDREQARLRAHSVIVFQFPLFWYSPPALVKEWLDLVLEPGFAYGEGGTALVGKTLMLAITAASPAEAYGPDGFQKFPIRDFLRPLEQTAALCQMRFTPPYLLFGALDAQTHGSIPPHVAGYRALLTALRDDRYDFDAAAGHDVITCDALPLRAEG